MCKDLNYKGNDKIEKIYSLMKDVGLKTATGGGLKIEDYLEISDRIRSAHHELSNTKIQITIDKLKKGEE